MGCQVDSIGMTGTSAWVWLSGRLSGPGLAVDILIPVCSGTASSGMTSLEDLIARVGYSDEVHLLLVNAYPITTFIGNERRNRYIHKSSHRQSRRQTKSRASLPYRLDQRTRASHRSCMRYSSHLLL